MIVAIVLSAGESSRMGSPKALLPLEGQSFIERIVTGFKASKVGKIIVVLGHNADVFREKVEHLPVTIVVNRDYAKGQLSSLTTAIRSLQVEGKYNLIEGVLVHLVDHPFLDPALVDEMIDQFYESKKLIVRPCFGARGGHPVLFSSRLFPELLAAPLDQGAKAVVYAHREEMLEIPTEDEGVVIDIDTQDEYRTRLERSR
ncbi:MAG: nucleotidyltransferase family protein [Candidatus Binatia bacterium]|jgi:molybdenum cofactor cytidylyltransferase|nr:nucleotidyltransferase family protein [Candidatus Binatia bacterium]